MLEYIKKQLAARAGVPTVAQEQQTTAIDPANVSNDLIMEYAPVMKGLDELSISGTHDDVDRPVIAIPLASDEEDEEVADIGIEDVKSQVMEDPELNTFEVQHDGTPVIPLDANIQESYYGMKEYRTFIQEGYSDIDFTDDMTPSDFDKRVSEYSESKFIEYRNEVLINESYGFEKVSMNDDNVAGDIFVEFDTNGSRTAVLEPNYQVDEFNNVRKKQIHSVDMMKKGNYLSKITPYMETLMESYGYNKANDGSVWNTVQPMTMNVPIDPIDKLSVIVGFKNMKNKGRMDYVRCSVPILRDFDTPIFESVAPETIKRMNDVSCTKGYAIQESELMMSIFEEAFDFGNTGDVAPGAQPEAQNAAPAQPEVQNATPTETQNAAEPEVQNATPDAGTDAGADNGKVSIPVETNNVSDQIAEKVASDTDIPVESQSGEETAAEIEKAGEVADAMPDVPMDEPAAAPDAEMSADGNVTTPGAEDPLASGDFTAGAIDPTANGSDAGVEAKLNELDSIGETNNADGMEQMAMGATDPTAGGDVSNLSMDEIIQQATEKIKALPIGVLQKFISGDQNALQEAYVMEAFGRKKKKDGVGINAEIDMGLRECLGILNDDQLSFKQIESKFKSSGKKLNKSLSAAAKSKDVYSAEEKKELSDLNESLTDLMVHFKPTKNNVEETKKKIMTFTNNAKHADTIIKRHKADATSDFEETNKTSSSEKADESTNDGNMNNKE